jgi:glucose/arabinose dehydrogenase
VQGERGIASAKRLQVCPHGTPTAVDGLRATFVQLVMPLPRILLPVTALLLAVLSAPIMVGQTHRALLQTPGIQLETVAGGFAHPVQVVWSHDFTGRAFVAQQDGRIFTLAPLLNRQDLFLDLRQVVSCCGNGGLLSLVFHPDYIHDHRLFVQYVDVDGNTAVASYRASDDGMSVDAASGVVLLTAEQPHDEVPNHHGGTLQFGPDGFLYISIGDGGAYVRVTTRAQDLRLLLGKMLRLDVDHAQPYAIPSDNPFFGDTSARAEVWSYGLRNPWRFSFDRLTGALYIADVGQDSWEEIDALTLTEARGTNFGWPMMEGMHCYPSGSACSSSTLTMPWLEYSHDQGCSVTGGYVYRGSEMPWLSEVYLFGDWCSGRLLGAAVSPAAPEITELLQSGAAIVSFGEDDYGELYVVDYRGHHLPRRAHAGAETCHSPIAIFWTTALPYASRSACLQTTASAKGETREPAGQTGPRRMVGSY